MKHLSEMVQEFLDPSNGRTLEDLLDDLAGHLQERQASLRPDPEDTPRPPALRSEAPPPAERSGRS